MSEKLRVACAFIVIVASSTTISGCNDLSETKTDGDVVVTGYGKNASNDADALKPKSSGSEIESDIAEQGDVPNLSEDTRQADFYVAATGSDTNPGTIDKPFATLQKARDSIRTRKTRANVASSVVVSVRGGRYFLDQPLTFTPEDSGVVYMSYPGEEATISGGRKITNWKRSEGKLWEANVKNVGPFRQLFVNDRRARITRLPATGYFNLLDVVKPEDRDDPVNRSGFKFAPGDLKKDWTNLGDAEIIKLHSWSEMRMPIVSVDEERNVVMLSGKTTKEWLPDWAGSRYYVENVFEALDSPGEWYLNRKTSTLYYWPLPGEEMTEADVVAPVFEHIIVFKGDVACGKFVKNITFKGFTLAHCDWYLPKDGYSEGQASIFVHRQIAEERKLANLPTDPRSMGRPGGAISAVGARACSLEDNHITHIGPYAIDLGLGCKNNRVTGNRFNDLGAGAIKIGPWGFSNKAPSDIEEPTGNIFADNYVYDGGIVYLGAVGVWIGNCGGNIISHNEVRDLNYTGISAGFMWGCANDNRGRDNIIEYNYIHHIARRMLNDGGGIYILGNSPGTIINNNLIHDVYTAGHLGRGIYLDQGSSFITVKNNIVYNTVNITCMGEGENLFENNIFINAETCQIWYCDNGCSTGDRLVRNIIYYGHPDATYCRFYGGQDAAEKKGFIAESDYNLIFRTDGKELRIEDFPGVETFAQWKAIGYDTHSIIADPMFIDPTNHNYSLKPDSPAFKLGFKQIDMSTVGPRPKRTCEK